MKEKIKKLQSFLLCLMMLVMSTVTAWGAAVTYNCTSSTDVTTLNSTSSQITVGSGTNTFYIYSANSLKSKPSSSGFSLATDKYQVSQTSDMIVVFVPTTSDNVSNIEFYASTSNTRKAYYKSSTDATTLTSSPSTTANALATTSTSYSLWNSFSKGTYYAFGGQTAGSGYVYIHKVVVTFSGSSTYNVTYNMNGHGDAIANTTGVTALPNPLPSPTATGYTFAGWYTDSGLTSAAVAGASIDADTPLYAKWTANTYTISLDGNGGSGGSSSVTATYGSALPSFTAPSQSGKQVTGYFTETSGGTKVINANGSLVNSVSGYTDSSGNWTRTSATTLYAKWEEAPTEKFKYVAVTSGSGDISAGTDTEITSSNYASVVSGGRMYFTNTAQKEPYNTKGIKLGRNAEYFKIVLNTALAVGDVITFTEGAGNSYQICFSTSAASEPNRSTAPQTTSGKYTVTSSDGLSGETTFYVWRVEGYGTMIKNLTITPASSTAYTVSFADGTCGDHGTYTGDDITQGSAGAEITLPTVEAESGWRFDGWYTNNNGTGTKYASGATMIPASTHTLYAWYVQQFTVTYDGNGSTGSVPTDTPHDAGSAVTVLGNTGSPALAKTYHTFVGWNTEADETGTYYNADDDIASITSDMTLYAVWKHLVTLAVNDANMGSITSATYVEAEPYGNHAAGSAFVSPGYVSEGKRITVEATPNTGYHFDTTANPYTDEGGETKYRPWGGGTKETNNPATFVVGDNKTYTAHFAANTYKVVFNANGGTGTMANQSFTYDEASKALTTNTFTRLGFTFNGWNTAADGSGTGYTDAQSVQNLTSEDGGTYTLYAQWRQSAAITVSFVDNHSKGTMPSAVVSSTLAATGVLDKQPSDIASGYIFKEWCTDAELTIPAVAGTAITENTTLYANYKINSTIDVSPVSGTLTKGLEGSNSVTSTLEGMTIYAAWGGAAQSFETVIGTTGKTSPRVDGFSYTDAGSTKVLSLVASDGTFYSDVQTATYTVGTVAPVITFSPNTVTITCETAGATIYYTTDGTEPSSSNGTAYSGTFTIDADRTIKAIAIKTVDATPYSSAVTTLACTYSASTVKTTLPVTYNFADGSGKWNYSGNFIESAGSLVTLENKAVEDEYHNIVFRCSSTTKFSMTNGSKLTMNDNASTSNFIAIPISGIMGRIDINVWAPYSSTADYTLRYVLDTSNGTTVQTTAPSGITTKKSLNKYDTDHYNFRIENIAATSGVLYLGRGESTFPDFEKIQVTTQDALLKADKTTVTIGDAQTDTVNVTNYTSYQTVLGTVPSCVDAVYDPTTGKLAITPKAVGSGTITMAVDTNGDGIAASADLSITVNVHGITIGTNPTSAVYDTSSGSPSPELSALTVSATYSGGASRTYQWYKNTVNSTTGGTAISGATSYTLETSKISTSAAEDASFYYCVVSATNCKPKTSDVAYVLTSKTRRYFQMSNVAGNVETSAAEEKITGQVIAGGNAYEENTSGETFRYITRPNTSVAHMYVANAGTKYFKVTLDNAIATGDVISVLLNGYLSDPTGITIATDASGSNAITLTSRSDTSVKTYASTFTDAFNSRNTFFIKGIYSGTTANYFTDLIIYKPVALAVSDPTPASQALQVGDSPAAISVTATGGTGAYTYQWYRNTEESTTGAVAITGATSASYTPRALTAESVDSVYYCAVTSGAVTVNSGYATVTVSETIEHGYMTIDGNEHEGLTFSFTDGKCSYTLLKDPHDTQDKATATQYTNFWTHEGDFSSSVKIASISSSNANYLRIKKDKSMTFYVRRATSFTIESGTNSSRQYKVTVDDVDMGTYSVNSESPRIALDHEGSKIVITSITSDIYIGRLNFYYSSMEIKKGSETVTEVEQYTDAGTVDYEVVSNSTGGITVDTSAEGYNSSVATATYDSEKGLLKVTSVAAGTCVVTLTQAASGDYAASTTTLTVTVKKHTLALEFSLEDTEIPQSVLSGGSAIPSGSLPTLKAYKDGVEVTDAAFNDLNINYVSDDPTIGRIADPGTSYEVIYGGGQGGALIYAYVEATTHVSAAKDYFGLNIKAGTSNAIPSGTQVKEQQRFELQDDEGASVVTLTYGGYRFDDTNGWAKAASRGKYHIDGYNYYTRHADDALDEYKRQLRGMLDENEKQTKALSGAPAADFWYDTTEDKPNNGGKYSKYERIRPLTLPCRGGYLKFQTHKTGTLTIYVWQNGSMNTSEKTLGSKPRLGYWFDQDGWVKKPKVAPITKTPLTSKGYGRDVFNDALTSEAKLAAKWTAAWDDADIVPMLLRKYTNASKTAFYTESGTGHTDLNPYYWMTQEEIETNLDEDRTIIPTKMTPVPYHNGYMVPEESYLKYVIDVVAGKTYYFYGMMTKVGYVGMNFIENNDVADVVNREVLHLKNTDDMKTLVDTLSHDYTVYSEATMPSNYRAGKWNTICLPFALSEQQVEETFGVNTRLTLYNGLIKKGKDYTIKYLSHVDGNILPGQPYFIKPSGVDANGKDLPNVGGVIGSVVDDSGDALTRITFSTVVIDKKQFDPAKCIYSSDADVDINGDATDTEGFKFTGSYAMTPIDQYSYLINPSTGNLRQYTGATTTAEKGLNPYHAFLKPNHTDVKHNAMSQIDFETNSIIEYAWLENETPDIPTEVISLEEEVVDALNSGRLAMPDKAYNIMGQEIDPRSAKGLVIINGKKVLY